MADMDIVLPLSEEHLCAIGRVTAYFSLLENGANTLIADLLELKSREDVISVTAHMMFSNKVQLIETLVSTRFKEEKGLGELISVIISDMKKSNERRNLIVHASWYYHSPEKNESGVLRQTARGKLKTSLEGLTPEDINKEALFILKASGKVQNFLMKKNGAIHFG